MTNEEIDISAFYQELWWWMNGFFLRMGTKPELQTFVTESARRGELPYGLGTVLCCFVFFPLPFASEGYLHEFLCFLELKEVARDFSGPVCLTVTTTRLCVSSQIRCGLFNFSNEHFCPRACLPSLSCLFRAGKQAWVQLQMPSACWAGCPQAPRLPARLWPGEQLGGSGPGLAKYRGQRAGCWQPVMGTVGHSYLSIPRDMNVSSFPVSPSLWQANGATTHTVGSSPLATPAWKGPPVPPSPRGQGSLRSSASPVSASLPEVPLLPLPGPVCKTFRHLFCYPASACQPVCWHFQDVAHPCPLSLTLLSLWVLG